MVHFTSFSRLYHKCNLRSLFVLDQMMVNTTAGNQSRNRHTASGDGTIGEHDNFNSVLNGL